ncbi:MAG: N-acetyl-gamma-glutamyl-phosphate reductase [Verrucomicrobiota bacterium]|jgi:N-acetyl-gamma-glutamyl-phosphate reductase|nr:N-acetyl-gamma-glutamyl-phosphate reductase [Verrucomicrobiota bacterium]MDK2963502.1 N-acetyl-gamma-glutamyl-phosphate reductase [Verrucomicrobiota bacterium]
MKRVKVVGVTGYGGVGIIELLLNHPGFQISCLVAAQETGMKLSELYPHLTGFCDETVLTPDDPKAQEPYDAVFFSTPDGVGMQTAAAELSRGAHVVDYSGDFRFATPEKYSAYASFIGKNPKHAAVELLRQTVYGLSELHPFGPEQKLAGNPGCFAVSCILGLAPAAANRLIRPKSVICDCKTGVSGAGKKPAPTFHYPARYEQINAYKLAGHQHLVEIEQELSALADETVQVTMTTQVLPLCRGILSCLYADLKKPMTNGQLMDAYKEFYDGKPFVRIFDNKANIGTAQVNGTNFCNLIVDIDERNNRLRVISHIDNLMKGQAGNALQNMNLMFGFDPTLGLNFPGRCP